MTRKKRIIANTGSFDELLMDELRDASAAQAYLEIAMKEFEEDRNTEAFLLALRTIAEAKGGLSKLAKKTKLSRQNLYRSLSKNGNPRLDTLSLILSSLGYRLSVQALGNR